MFNTIYESGRSMEAWAWLDKIPKPEAQTMLPSEFRTAFRNRFMIPHPQLLAHTTCTCGKVVDPYGIHMQKCRLDGNLTNATHNNLVGGVPGRDDGQSVRVDVSGIFDNVDPSGNQRMDLVPFPVRRGSYASSISGSSHYQLRQYPRYARSGGADQGAAIIVMPRPWQECSCTAWQLRSMGPGEMILPKCLQYSFYFPVWVP